MIEIVRLNLEPTCDNCGVETRYLYEIKEVEGDKNKSKYYCSQCVADLTGPNTGKVVIDN